MVDDVKSKVFTASSNKHQHLFGSNKLRSVPFCSGLRSSEESGASEYYPIKCSLFFPRRPEPSFELNIWFDFGLNWKYVILWHPIHPADKLNSLNEWTMRMFMLDRMLCENKNANDNHGMMMACLTERKREKERKSDRGQFGYLPKHK